MERNQELVINWHDLNAGFDREPKQLKQAFFWARRYGDQGDNAFVSRNLMSSWAEAKPDYLAIQETLRRLKTGLNSAFAGEGINPLTVYTNTPRMRQQLTSYNAPFGMVLGQRLLGQVYVPLTVVLEHLAIIGQTPELALGCQVLQAKAEQIGRLCPTHALEVRGSKGGRHHITVDRAELWARAREIGPQVF